MRASRREMRSPEERAEAGSGNSDLRHEKSDDAIVAVKPTNKAERSAAEPAEPRAEAKGNAGSRPARQAQS